MMSTETYLWALSDVLSDSTATDNKSSNVRAKIEKRWIVNGKNYGASFVPCCF